MLDQETKKKINDLRDTLVGKVPDPKSQVEQIMIALIYKFMNDMDKESTDLGGEASFFVDDFERYSWDNLFGTKVSGSELVDLYSTAVESMEENPNIPQLFRDIFKNAYIPYKDAETLRLFLSQIDDFEYSKDSEQLGDAFEHILNSLSSQGDAGQFRTPRHIIDFIVEIVDPKKDETVLDPASGTSGFLISAFKHIVQSNSEKSSGDLLSATERKKIMKNINGYDISPDMVRIGLANMYLHGFPEPNVVEYDALTSEDRWNEYYDVILANPPFMTPKGGIRPHNKFGLKSNRAEVLFVDYILTHLKPKGRAGIIVPEGIIFQTGKAYKELRKKLVENGLIGVISLPSGVFQPYSGVKTSILLVNRSKKTEHLFFAEVKNDGFSLGSQRKPIELNDLPKIKSEIVAENFKKSIRQILKQDLDQDYSFNFKSLQIENLTSSYEIDQLKNLCQIKTGKKDVNQGNPNGEFPFFTCAQEHTYSDVYSFDTEAIIIAGNGDVGNTKYYKGKFEAYQRTYVLSEFSNLVLPKYLYFILNSKLKTELNKLKQGSTMPYIKVGFLNNFQIPLPPLEKQQEIVDEIEQYQKVIDGARQVIDNYKPTIVFDNSWKERAFENTSLEIIDGDRGKNYPKSEDFLSEGYCLFLNTKNVLKNGFNFSENKFITKEKSNQLRKGKLKRNDVVLTTRGTIGNTAYYDNNVQYENIRINSGMLIFRSQEDEILSEFLFYFFQSSNFIKQYKALLSGTAQPQLPISSLKNVKIPIPDISVQKDIILKIKEELVIIENNKKIINSMQEKINNLISKLYIN